MFKEEDEKADGNSTVTDDLDQLQVISVNSISHLNMILLFSTLRLFTPALHNNMFKEEDEKVDGNSTVTDDLDQPQVISVNSQSHLNMILKAVYQSWDEYNAGLNEATKNKHHLKVRDSSTIVAYNSKQSSKTKLPLAWKSIVK
jgi:hypothetical protein